MNIPQWLDANKHIPQLTNDGLTSKRNILFACNDGEVYAGHYHRNGCFYDENRKAVAFTERAAIHYAMYKELRALWWCEYPAHPDKNKLDKRGD